MFGNKSDQMQHMVEKHEWEKILKKLGGLDTESKVELASACGNSQDEDAPNILVTLVKDSNESVQLQAAKSLGMVGRQNAKTTLQWLSGHLPDDRVALKEAIKDAIIKIGNRR